MEGELLKARVLDTARRCERAQKPCFLGFLSPAESALAEGVLKNAGVRFCFGGGFEGAERTYLACIPDWCEEPVFPISAVTFTFRQCDGLSHRDFLGALTALGIARETIGDILVESGRAVAFISSDISGYVMQNIDKVGRVGVTLSDGFESPLPCLGKTVEASDTIASNRLDCVVGALVGTSRAVACEIIEDGRVSINSLCTQKATRKVCENDRVSIKGKGRFQILSVCELSKKGRIILKYNKYI